MPECSTKGKYFPAWLYQIKNKSVSMLELIEGKFNALLVSRVEISVQNREFGCLLVTAFFMDDI